MRSGMSNKGRPLGLHHHTPCTRTHQIGALLLVASTFFLSRLFDRSCSLTPSSDLSRTSRAALPVSDGGDLSWPQRGYGPHLDLKIYVYDEAEVDGLRDLMYGKERKITALQCIKGQWGTQVISLFTLFCFFITV